MPPYLTPQVIATLVTGGVMLLMGMAKWWDNQQSKQSVAIKQKELEIKREDTDTEATRRVISHYDELLKRIAEQEKDGRELRELLSTVQDQLNLLQQKDLKNPTVMVVVDRVGLCIQINSFHNDHYSWILQVLLLSQFLSSKQHQQ